MEILSTESIHSILTVVKIAFFIAGLLILATHFFYAKETNKMANKLQIFLPGSIRTAISIELALAITFVIFSTIILFLL